MNEDTTANVNLGNDVQIIRNILFGEQLQGYQERLEDLEKQVKSLSRENKTLKKANEDETDKWKQELLNLSNQISDLETIIREQDQDLKGSVQALRKDFDSKFDGLITSLAKALENYQKSSRK